MTNSITQKFLNLCKSYSEKKEALYFSQETNQTESIFSISLNLIKIDFCFLMKGGLTNIYNTLYCRIYLNKTSPIYHHLPDIFAALDIKEFEACYFPYIYTTAGMELCFKKLVNLLEKYLDTITENITNGKLNDSHLLEEYIAIFSLKDELAKLDQIGEDRSYTEFFLGLQKWRNTSMITRFTTWRPYSLFLLGKREKSLLSYKKLQNKNDFLFAYEKALIRFIESDESENFSPIDEDCFYFKTYLELTQFSPSFLKYPLTVFIIFSIIFCSAFAICNLILSKDSVFFLSAPWYNGFLPAALCSIFGSISFRRTLYRTIEKKSKRDRLLDMDKMVNSKKINIFAHTLFVLVVAFSIFASVMILCYPVTLYEDSFKFPDPEKTFVYNTYKYQEIDSLYYIKSRYNDFGDRINRPSYVIKMRDGMIYDLDMAADNKTMEKKIIPFIKSKGFEPIILDSDKQLPKSRQ